MPEEEVDHPDHYNTGKIETIDYIDSLGLTEGFCAGNAIKYLSRYKHKKQPAQDLKKAMWYIQYLINKIESENS
jgi:hypothetical protein